MPDVKTWFRNLQPVQLYIVLAITIVFFLTELVVSHITHALTLLVDSYHMLVNIFALTGGIITIKYGTLKKDECTVDDLSQPLKLNDAEEISDSGEETKPAPATRSVQEQTLRNTFGWARIDVISMLICCIFLASLCFSALVEALQTLVHIDHQDEMHHPYFVMYLGIVGLLVNGVCYQLIGGYTFHQGSFLYVTENGDVVLNKVVADESIKQGQKRLSKTKSGVITTTRQRQGCWEMLRDVSGCFLVIACAVIIIFVDENKEIAKLVDPIISIFSAISLMFFSYPYMKESCLILLQTIPNSMNIDQMRKELLNRFPDIVNIHDFHVWQLTTSKIISTVHINFQNPKVYKQIIEEIRKFILDSGITQVTIQPEFYQGASLESLSSKNSAELCLMKCLKEECKSSHCCPDIHQEDALSEKLKSASKERIPVANQTPDLKSVKILNDELRPGKQTPSVSIIEVEYMNQQNRSKNSENKIDSSPDRIM